MDNLEYEFSGQNLSRSREYGFVIEVKPKEPVDQDSAVKFSIDIIKALEDKAKAHNSSQNKKVTLYQLKKVFCESFEDSVSDENVSNTVWAFAKVNLYLRMASGEHSASVNVVNTYKKPNLIEISANWLPTETDIKEAQQYVDEKNLTHEFASLDDLYINFQPIQWEID
jgi:hypothetical protein